jgi:hypothetical protein
VPRVGGGGIVAEDLAAEVLGTTEVAGEVAGADGVNACCHITDLPQIVTSDSIDLRFCLDTGIFRTSPVQPVASENVHHPSAILRVFKVQLRVATRASDRRSATVSAEFQRLTTAAQQVLQARLWVFCRIAVHD